MNDFAVVWIMLGVVLGLWWAGVRVIRRVERRRRSAVWESRFGPPRAVP